MKVIYMSRPAASTKDMIKRAKEIHGDKYDYSKFIYNGYNVNFKIICPIHGIFELNSPKHFRYKQGCNECLKDSFKEKYKKQMIIQAVKLYGNKYTYEKVVYKNAHEKVKIYCKKCQKYFNQSPNSHKRGHGCPYCSAITQPKKYKKTAGKRFIKKSKKLYNNKFCYDSVKYKGRNKEVEIWCKEGERYFWETPAIHMTKAKLQNKRNNITTTESLWIKDLNNPNIIVGETLYHNKRWYHPDGYDPTTNTIYEFYGDYWHGNFNGDNLHPNKINPTNKKTFSQLYIDTVQRFNRLENAGYKIKFVWERDYKKGIMFSDDL
mgnify:CR=1 FL=1